MTAGAPLDIVEICGAADRSIFLPGNPVPASRPRVTQYGTFYPQNYRAWRSLQESNRGMYETDPVSSPIALVIDVAVERPKTSKLILPGPDIDNYAKAPMDFLQGSKDRVGILMADDKQVSWLIARKRWADPNEEPGFTIHRIIL